MNLLGALNAPILNKARSPTRGTAVVPTALPVAGGGAYAAENLSAVFACIQIKSSDIGCLPSYVFNRFTNKRWKNHPALALLNQRPNVRMTPFTRRKLLEYSIYTTGNAYDWIVRDPISREAVELVPLVGTLVQRLITKEGSLWYAVTDPISRELFYLPQEDICDYKDFSRDGVEGLSVLSYARETISSGLAAQAYNRSFYEHGGQPSGVLMVDTPMSGNVMDPVTGQPTDKKIKDAIREEWERTQGGAQNAHRIAVLDYGMKYQSLGISQKDAMFVEQQDITVADVARFFNFPLYKLQSGKQSYQSNEQQGIEYVNSLRPNVLQREQEQSFKLLPPSQQERGWCIRTNMMALLRSDSGARAGYYKTMRELGAYSVNDIRALEDLPGVEGGDEYLASLNYVPLKDFSRLSTQRAGGDGLDPGQAPEEGTEEGSAADPEETGTENGEEKAK